jgi:hypothetical protein
MARTLKEVMATLPPERRARIEEASKAEIARLRPLIAAEQLKSAEMPAVDDIDPAKKEEENE